MHHFGTWLHSISFKELTRYVRHGIGHIMNSFRIRLPVGAADRLGDRDSNLPRGAQIATPKEAQPPAPGCES